MLEGLLRLRLKNPALALGFRQRLEADLAACPLTAAGIDGFHETRALYDLFLLPRLNGMWENYLVNGIFKNIFLKEERGGYFTAWFQLVLQFVLARFLLLVEFSKQPDDFGEAELIELLQQLTRAVGHDSLYLEQAAAWISGQEDEESALHRFCSRMI